MAKIFDGIENIVIYLDDVLIFGQNEVEHDETLKLVLNRIRSHNLSLNIGKCEFSTNKVSFLGHIIENGESNPIKIG